MKVREGVELVFTGEGMDVKSRGVVRRRLDKKLRDDWHCWTGGMNRFSRDWMVDDAMRDLERYWSKRKDGDILAYYSQEAVREEIDYYLPKTFWKHRRSKKQSAANVTVDPDWKTFQDWLTDYPETIVRLKRESDAAHEQYLQWMQDRALE